MSGPLDPDRWRRLKEVFGAALALEGERRAAYLADACGGDDALRVEAEALLAASGEGAFDSLHRAFSPSHEPLGLEASPGDASRFGELELVGAGGMGVVYKARDAALGRWVALKFLHVHSVADPGATERFLLEARAAASLDHANVCAIHEVGETADGRLFLTMPFYEGETLRDRIARGPLPVDDAVSIATQICRGLSAAHARGIVHRDIKPANVLLTEEGVVKILDFGIAKLSGVEITRPGLRMGSLAYASPEQLRGDAVDSRTDVWSVGVVLYEMLAGERPFPGDDEAAVRAAQLRGDPVPLDHRRPDVPAGLGSVVTQALAKDPAARFASVTELATALGRPPAGSGRTRWQGLSRARLRAWAGAGVAAIGVLAAAVASIRSDGVTVAQPIALAVLPLEWLGTDDNQFMADAVHSELLTTLSRIDAFRVTSRLSVLPYRGSAKSDRDIARELGVAYLVEGGVWWNGDRYEVDIRVTEPGAERLVWGETFVAAASADALHATQARIAEGILTSLQTAPTATERNRLGRPSPTASLTAYELYHRALAAFDGTRAGNLETERLLRLALAADSGYADAWAHHATNFAWRPLWTGFPETYWDSALVAAARARELDANNSEALMAEGIVRLYQGFLRDAERINRRALQLEPNSGHAMRHLSVSVLEQGRIDEALPLHVSAVRFSPHNLVYRSWVGHAYLMLGDAASAERWYREVLALQPDFWAPLEGLALIALQQGRRDSMIRLADREVATYPDDPAVLAAAAMVAHYARDYGRAARYARRADEIAAGAPTSAWDMLATTILGYARLVEGDAWAADSLFAVSSRFLDERLRQGATWYRWPYELGAIHAVRGRRAEALEWLERAEARGLRSRWLLTENPMLEPLRAQPRFTSIVARVDSAVAAMRRRVN